MVSGIVSDPSIGYSNRRYPKVNLPRPKTVKNKSPAGVQITAEQILREARERQEADEIWPPKQNITDSTELADHRLRRRSEFEEQIRRARGNVGVYVKYAQWEESQMEYARARSVWERALDVDGRNHTIWVKYAESEMENKFVNRARNVWDRAVTRLPRVDQLWYKYIHMEEVIGNVAGARQIFERWMNWSPDEKGWLSYVKFELRYNEIERARSIFERAAEKLRDGEDAEQLCSAFAAFREQQHGGKENIQGDIVLKEMFQYEDEISKNPLNYDLWFDYIRLEESVRNKDRIRELYERAIAHVPPAMEKQYWQRYIYLWINYALYEELEVEDVERTRDIYRECLNLIPHHRFSFAKVWWLAAELEIRQLDLKGARRILGNAIGKAPKCKIFKKYIEMELQLGNIDRCRKLYNRFLEWRPENCFGWTKYGQLEASFFETERARAIFELGICQPVLDMPELLWKAYIDFEMSKGKPENARALYERLHERARAKILDEESPRDNLKILEAAYKWKQQKVAMEKN